MITRKVFHPNGLAEQFGWKLTVWVVLACCCNKCREARWIERRWARWIERRLARRG